MPDRWRRRSRPLRGPTRAYGLNPWLTATPAGSNTQSGTVGPLQDGVHIIYAYATDGGNATSINTGSGNGTSSSPLIGQIQAFVFFINSTAPTLPLATLDIDGSNTATKYDAPTDGLLAIRYMFGLTGPSLTAGALGGTASRNDPTAVKAYLDANRSAFDIDGDGNVDALTDGLLILRYLFGLRGDSLIQGAFVPGAPRNTAMLIESYLATLTP